MGSLALSLVAGAAVHSFPDVLYSWLLGTAPPDSQGNPAMLWGLAEVYCFTGFLCLSAGFAVLLPVTAVITKRYRDSSSQAASFVFSKFDFGKDVRQHSRFIYLTH